MAEWAVASGWQRVREEPDRGYGHSSSSEKLQFVFENATETSPGIIVNLD